MTRTAGVRLAAVAGRQPALAASPRRLPYRVSAPPLWCSTGDRGRRATVQSVSLVDEVPADGALPADAVIVARLRDRDETMFATLVDAWSPGMLRAARAYVADEHTAQDVVQE